MKGRPGVVGRLEAGAVPTGDWRVVVVDRRRHPAEVRGEDGEKREVAAEIAAAGRFLETSDRDLVRTIFENGVSTARVARAMGKQPYEVARRVKRLVRRLNDPYTRFVISRHPNWPELRRNVGLRFFVRGVTQRRTAEQLGVTVHRVRQELQFIRALYEAEYSRALQRVNGNGGRHED